MNEPVSQHLGDGAYVTVTDNGELYFTANHHDPVHATSVVYLDPGSVPYLIKFLQENCL